MARTEHRNNPNRGRGSLRSGRGGKARPQPREVSISKAMSLLLRHRAGQEGLKLDESGWASLADLFLIPRVRSLTPSLPEIIRIVAADAKGRFELSPAPPPLDNLPPELTASEFRIRATQGHSIKLEAEKLGLERVGVEMVGLPETVVHATFYSAWELVLKAGGLSPMGRAHVHCAVVEEAGRIEVLKEGRGEKTVDEEVEGVSERAESVPTVKIPALPKSGIRPDAPLHVHISLRRSLATGLPWYRSQNGVWLSPGDGEDGRGVVGVECWERVVDVGKKKKDGEGKVLWQWGGGERREDVVGDIREKVGRMDGQGHKGPRKGVKVHVEGELEAV
ncbi:MAG: hypothetical protein M1814_006241 [Vezdaea aestivalis]|nr:MAG: hypothetical protein M1814_006241 [Vezdaea aestivalis]